MISKRRLSILLLLLRSWRIDPACKPAKVTDAQLHEFEIVRVGVLAVGSLRDQIPAASALPLTSCAAPLRPGINLSPNAIKTVMVVFATPRWTTSPWATSRTSSLPVTTSEIT